jgi:hypothetical protein
MGAGTSNRRHQLSPAGKIAKEAGWLISLARRISQQRLATTPSTATGGPMVALKRQGGGNAAENPGLRGLSQKRHAYAACVADDTATLYDPMLRDNPRGPVKT